MFQRGDSFSCTGRVGLRECHARFLSSVCPSRQDPIERDRFLVETRPTIDGNLHFIGAMRSPCDVYGLLYTPRPKFFIRNSLARSRDASRSLRFASCSHGGTVHLDRIDGKSAPNNYEIYMSNSVDLSIVLKRVFHRHFFAACRFHALILSPVEILVLLPALSNTCVFQSESVFNTRRN